MDIRIEASRRRPRSLHIAAREQVARPPAEVFAFLTERVPEVYGALAPGHEQFAVEGGGPVRPHAHIDCHERAGNQEVRHRYVVEAYEPARHLYYASRPTEARIHLKRRTIESRSDTHVYYDLREHFGTTELTLTIVIQLPHRLQMLLALASGSQALWQAHARDELAVLRRMIEESRTH